MFEIQPSPVLREAGVKFYDAILTLGEQVKGTEDYKPYNEWLKKFYAFTEIEARAGRIDIWQEEQDGELPQILHPFFNVTLTPPHEPIAHYFGIDNAKLLLQTFKEEYPWEDEDRAHALLFTARLTILLEDQEPHSDPENLRCLNKIEHGNHFSWVKFPKNCSKLFNVEEALELFKQIEDDESLDPSFQFFASLCRGNLEERLTHLATHATGLKIYRISDQVAREVLYCPPFEDGLLEVIAETADVCAMNNRAFAGKMGNIPKKEDIVGLMFKQMFYGMLSLTLYDPTYSTADATAGAANACTQFCL